MDPDYHFQNVDPLHCKFISQGRSYFQCCSSNFEQGSVICSTKLKRTWILRFEAKTVKKKTLNIIFYENSRWKYFSETEDRKTERQKDRKTERQKDRKAERQEDRKTNRQKERIQKDRKVGYGPGSSFLKCGSVSLQVYLSRSILLPVL